MFNRTAVVTKDIFRKNATVNWMGQNYLLISGSLATLSEERY